MLPDTKLNKNTFKKQFCKITESRHFTPSTNYSQWFSSTHIPSNTNAYIIMKAFGAFQHLAPALYFAGHGHIQ